MKTTLRYIIVIALVNVLAVWGQSSHSEQKSAASNKKAASSAGWKSVDDAMGRTGQEQPGGVRKYGMPRKDLDVSVNGVQVKPGFALGSWAAFNNPGKNAMVMGDLVLTQDEVAPVMQKLESGTLSCNCFSK